MSLELKLGTYAWARAAGLPTDGIRGRLELVNQVLAEWGLGPHEEPQELPPLVFRAYPMSIPYDWLHRLRRAAAHWRQDPDWTWTPSADAHRDPGLIDELTEFRLHLVCHSDSDGYYVPIDFAEIPADRRAPGGLIGSTHQLRMELTALAPRLRIQLDGEDLSDEAAAALDGEPASTPMSPERHAWLVLFEACRLSLTHGTVIEFA